MNISLFSPKDKTFCFEFCIRTYGGSWEAQIISRHPQSHSFPHRFATQIREGGTTSMPQTADWQTLLDAMALSIEQSDFSTTEKENAKRLLFSRSAEEIFAAFEDMKMNAPNHNGSR